MKIVIAPDSFKESLSAAEVAAAIADAPVLLRRRAADIARLWRLARGFQQYGGMAEPGRRSYLGADGCFLLLRK